MSGISKKLMGTTAAGGGFLAIEDAFSTYVYSGDATTRDIVNGIDLANEGGMVWIKTRNSGNQHFLFDTERGVQKYLSSNNTDAEGTLTNALSAFNSDGFEVMIGLNNTGDNQASWTFRKAPRFFDVVTYTGNDTGQSIPHNLGVAPGCILIKEIDGTSNWGVYHRGIGATKFLNLNEVDAATTFSNVWNDTEPTDAVFTVGNETAFVNNSNHTYVAYLFAHDPLGPSEDGSDGLIACGSYTSNSGGAIDVNLGWEPQWIMVKNTAGRNAGWVILDTMRGFSWDATNNLQLLANASYSELDVDEAGAPRPTPTGFSLAASNQYAEYNNGTDEIIYIAIRRGPMRAPESGTEVFAPTTWVGDNAASRLIATSTDVTDLVIARDQYNTNTRNIVVYDRLRGDGRSLQTSNTNAEAVPSGADYDLSFDTNGGFLVHNNVWAAYLNYSPYNILGYSFRRAPGFFDVVAYTGDGVAGRTVPHNLGVAPEMVFVKCRDLVKDWMVTAPTLPSGKFLRLNGTNPIINYGANWRVDGTSTELTLGSEDQVNGAGNTYIAYLFATLAGVSKVGSYTGNGTSQTINCGFTTGARFILIKRTDSTGDWYVWDTARGIVAANDPHLSLNTTAAEVTTDDSIDPDSSGFIVNQVAATNINVSAASYIFYAVS